MRAVDTNVLVRLVTRDDAKQVAVADVVDSIRRSSPARFVRDPRGFLESLPRDDAHREPK